MKNKRSLLIMWIISIIPSVILAFLYGDLPDIVPTHFGIDGAADAYGPKSTLWVIALICPAMAATFQFLPAIDPKKSNYAKFQKYYDLFAIFMELFMLVVLCLVLTEILAPGTVSMGQIVTLLMAALFLLVGNMMGKVKQNFYFGIKTPWTLADPDVWIKTHSLCGKLWFAFGLLLIPCALLMPESVLWVFFLVGTIAVALIPLVYSYLCYRKNHSEGTGGEDQ